MRNMLKMKKMGFTMVELLVVLVIVAILAAVAAPIYLANTRRAIASDAVAAMSVIRQVEREYFVKNQAFLDIADGALYGSALDVDLGVTQYFSNDAFMVDTSSPAWIGTTSNPDPDPADYIITANGSKSDACPATGAPVNCAQKTGASQFCLQMDNSGRTKVSYNSPNCVGGTWENY